MSSHLLHFIFDYIFFAAELPVAISSAISQTATPPASRIASPFDTAAFHAFSGGFDDAAGLSCADTPSH
jgi:hypothetical protein